MLKTIAVNVIEMCRLNEVPYSIVSNGQDVDGVMHAYLLAIKPIYTAEIINACTTANELLALSVRQVLIVDSLKDGTFLLYFKESKDGAKEHNVIIKHETISYVIFDYLVSGILPDIQPITNMVH